MPPAPSPRSVFLIGNPNSGKTSFFNALTGENVKIGNWPGVTVERYEGRKMRDGKPVAVIDLPGCYSLNPFTPEERIVLGVVDEAAQNALVNIIDSGNLERNLVLTLQLHEIGITPILAFNCYDELQKHGGAIDAAAFSRLSGWKALPTVARSGTGVESLWELIFAPAPAPAAAELDCSLPQPFRQACVTLLRGEGRTWEDALPSERLNALNQLIDDRHADPITVSARTTLAETLKIATESLACWLATNRFERLNALINGAVTRATIAPLAQQRIDEYVTHPVFGIPFFLALMALVFWSTFSLGGIPGEWIKAGVLWVQTHGMAFFPNSLLGDLVFNGMVAGVGGVLVFLPNVFILFLWIALLEDSGYLARSAFIMDRFMQAIGLHGCAFIPMVMGFGCNVPAIMAARILNSSRHRRQLMLMIPLLGCSARLPVLVLLTGAFFPANPGRWLFGIYLANIILVFFLGWMLSKWFGSDRDSHFLLEMPPYRYPVYRNVKAQLLEKVWHFVEKAGTVILWGTVLIWFLQAFPREVPLSRNYGYEITTLSTRAVTEEQRAQLEHLISLRDQELLEGRYMAKIGKQLLPLVQPLGLGWREAVALIPGFLAKESIVSTLAILYSPASHDLGTAMRKSGMNPAGALAFMVLSLLYVPCLATVGIIYKESGSVKLTALSLGLPLVLAFGAGFITFRLALFWWPLP
jgi:ferrous iron transport protein B